MNLSNPGERVAMALITVLAFGCAVVGTMMDTITQMRQAKREIRAWWEPSESELTTEEWQTSGISEWKRWGRARMDPED